MASNLRQSCNEFYPYTQVAPLPRSLLLVGQLQSPSPTKQKQKTIKRIYLSVPSSLKGGYRYADLLLFP